MHRLLVVLILIFTCLSKISGQMIVSQPIHNFGDIHNYNNDTAYFSISNNSSKTVYFLPVQPQEEFQVLCDTKVIEPGGLINIGIIYYTDKKGRFNLDVPLYFSNNPEPIKLTVMGNIKSILPTAMTICPSIENSRPLNNTVPLNVIVRDRITEEQIKDARVEVAQGKKIAGCVPGFRNMAFQCRCSYGKLKVSAESNGYLPSTVHFDFDADNNTCVVYLEKSYKDTITIKYNNKIIVKKDTVKEEIIVYKPAGNSNKDFNSTSYKPNHLIFVIDVSGSMKDSFKLGYLKASVKALIAILRPQDYITLITYASKPKLVFENVNGVSKDVLYETIDSLHAKGGSVGSDALNMAYEMAHNHFIKEGNNQIFLSTDGLFNGSHVNENDLYRMARHEYQKSGIKLTTIAFGKNEKARMFLSELSSEGHGQSLSITHMPADEEILIEEVKSQSLK